MSHDKSKESYEWEVKCILGAVVDTTALPLSTHQGSQRILPTGVCQPE